MYKVFCDAAFAQNKNIAGISCVVQQSENKKIINVATTGVQANNIIEAELKALHFAVQMSKNSGFILPQKDIIFYSDNQAVVRLIKGESTPPDKLRRLVRKTQAYYPNGVPIAWISRKFNLHTDAIATYGLRHDNNNRLSVFL